MQQPNLIWTHWKKEQKRFEHHLQLLKKRMDPEAIHESRVAVKKLRAILGIYLQLRKEEGYENLLLNTEVLFGIMGKQRDIGICLALLPGFEKENNYPFHELASHLKEQRKKAMARTNRAIHVYHKKELPRVAYLLKNDPGLNDETALLSFIHETLNSHILTIRTYFKKPHRLRQHLKQLYYWTDLLLGEEYRREELHEVLDDIGNWQDAEILLARARHFRKDYLPSSFEEYNRIKSLEQQLETRKEKFRKAALGKTTAWQKKLLQTG
jgi:CHAD domain-containing protein